MLLYTYINTYKKATHHNDTWWQPGDEENPLKLEEEDRRH